LSIGNVMINQLALVPDDDDCDTSRNSTAISMEEGECGEKRQYMMMMALYTRCFNFIALRIMN
jgi:hypothetical protein